MNTKVYIVIIVINERGFVRVVIYVRSTQCTPQLPYDYFAAQASQGRVDEDEGENNLAKSELRDLPPCGALDWGIGCPAYRCSYF